MTGPADRLVDARGLRCPWPALRAAAAMRDAEIVTVVADDPAAPDEIAALAAARGWIFSADEPGRLRLQRSIGNTSLA